MSYGLLGLETFCWLPSIEPYGLYNDMVSRLRLPHVLLRKVRVVLFVLNALNEL
jgi:hypothetical protein